ncbi:O-methyltransferase [Actinomyces sp. zg-332]|uniref:O-methyltransferase n=1 Tax=Actinomyces sp. zg-332 TaxID=2708340 RepID=UPI0022B78C38|nr:O-methyltransferase [Actinomyces sp. zg-332]
MENYTQLDDLLELARQHSIEYGLKPISPSAGSTLRLLVSTTKAKAVAEIGTGTGSSGLWILRGLTNGGMLTTIDYESHCQSIAKKIFEKAGYKSNTVRIINDRALNVLPRMAKNAYDIVVIDGKVDETIYYYEYSKQMVRPGGLIVVLHSLHNGKVADPAMRDRDTICMRELLKTISKDEEVVSTLIGNDDGMTVCMKVLQ